MNQNLCVNKTDFDVQGFALGLALKQRRKATRKSPIGKLVHRTKQSKTKQSNNQPPNHIRLNIAKPNQPSNQRIAKTNLLRL